MKKKLSTEELEKKREEILEDFEKGEFISVENAKEEIAEATQVAARTLRRNSRVNLRLTDTDLQRVKRIAAEEGLPYQTLLASIIHKFVSGQLQAVNRQKRETR